MATTPTPAAPAAPTAQSQGKTGGVIIGFIVALIICIVIALAIKKAKVAVNHWAPSNNPAVHYDGPIEKMVNHWGHTLVAGDEEWFVLETKPGRKLNLGIDLPDKDKPTRADFDAAWAQLRAREIRFNGTRSEEHPVKYFLNKGKSGLALEVKAIRGKYSEILLVEDHPRQ